MLLSRSNIWHVLGHAGMLTLVLYSIIYYQERTLFIDTAYQLFELINFEQLFVSAGRYSDYIVKFPSWLALNLGAGVDGVLMTFSVGITLIYYGVFIICVHLLKNPYAGLAIVLNLIVCMRMSFYHPLSETHQALVYSCLFWAWLYHPLKVERSYEKVIKTIVLLLIVSLAFFAHPVAALLLGFVMIYWILDKKVAKTFLPWVIMAFIVGLALFKMSTTPVDSYEGKFFQNLSGMLNSTIEIFDSHTWEVFIHEFRRLYFSPTLLLLVTLLILLLRKQFIKALGLVFFSVGTFVVMVVSSPVDSLVMTERSLLPWGFIILFFFVKEVLSGLQNRAARKLGLIFTSLVIIGAFYGLRKTGDYFNDRLNYMGQLIEVAKEEGTDKLLIPLEYVDSHYINVSWAFGYESLMYSIVNDQPATTVYIATGPLNHYPYTNEKAFLAPVFSKIKFCEQMNPAYFQVSDTTPYVVYEKLVAFAGR